MKFSRNFYIVFTVTVADPAVFTSTDHELYANDTVRFITTGALPTGLEVDTDYYVLLDGITADTFRLSTSQDGDAIVTSGTQSGTHSFVKSNRARLSPAYQSNR